MCAEDNIQVAQPTTPAQMFHLLRGQVLRRLRKPLIVMTPKSLLRLPAARRRSTSSRPARSSACSPTTRADPAKVTRVLLCTGKIYYELAEERARRKDRRPSRSCASSSSIRGGRTWSPRARRRTPSSRMLSGCRTSRATWAPRTFVTPRLEAAAARTGRSKLRRASRAPRARARRPARTRRT